MRRVIWRADRVGVLADFDGTRNRTRLTMTRITIIDSDDAVLGSELAGFICVEPSSYGSVLISLAGCAEQAQSVRLDTPSVDRLIDALRTARQSAAK